MPKATHQRYLRNFLLDKPFQLRFTGYAVIASLLVAALLGAFLWDMGHELMGEASAAVEARAQAAQTSHELGNAVLSNSLMQHLNDPAFEAQLKEQSRKVDQQYEQERGDTERERAMILRRQTYTWIALWGSLLAFVLIVAGASIVVTHRIAGPIFRIKRMLNEVAEGHLKPANQPLRESDELQELFATLRGMVEALRTHEMETVIVVEGALKKAEVAGAAEPILMELRALLVRMRRRIE